MLGYTLVRTRDLRALRSAVEVPGLNHLMDVIRRERRIARLRRGAARWRTEAAAEHRKVTALSRQLLDAQRAHIPSRETPAGPAAGKAVR